MAAHVLTAIDQILKNPDFEFKHINAALNLQCWTGDLGFEHYLALHRAAGRGPAAVEQWADDHRGHYANLWLDLGMPETREEWMEAKRNSR